MCMTRTHTMGLEDFLGYWYIEVEIYFEVEEAEPPCQYSNGNWYPGCSAQIHLLDARILSMTGTTLDLDRKALAKIDNGFYLKKLDKLALEHAREDSGIIDDLVESV